MANQYEELKPCPCCRKEAAPYWKGAGCTNTDCLLCGVHFDYEDWQSKRAELTAIKGAQAGEAEPGCTKPGCFPYCDCDSIDSPPNPPAYGAVPVRRELLERVVKYYEDGMSIYGECEELRALLVKAEVKP